jgi:hypothetical protein
VKEVAISEFKAKCLALLEQVRQTKKPLRVTRCGEFAILASGASMRTMSESMPVRFFALSRGLPAFFPELPGCVRRAVVLPSRLDLRLHHTSMPGTYNPAGIAQLLLYPRIIQPAVSIAAVSYYRKRTASLKA